MPYVQRATLTPQQLRSVRAGELDLDHLRTTAASAVGTEPPALAQLQLDLNLGNTIDSAGRILLVVVIVAAVAILAVVAVGKWRRFVVGRVKRLVAEAWDAVCGLNSPRRLLLLIGGNLATEILFALSLATFALAFQQPISLGQAVLINVSVALLSGLIPVPGGVGVGEGALTYGLVQPASPRRSPLRSP